MAARVRACAFVVVRRILKDERQSCDVLCLDWTWLVSTSGAPEPASPDIRVHQKPDHVTAMF